MSRAILEAAHKVGARGLGRLAGMLACHRITRAAVILAYQELCSAARLLEPLVPEELRKGIDK